MVCKRNSKLTDAPHRVEVRVAAEYSGRWAYQARWKDAQKQMYWLGHPDNGAQGEFINGWINEDEGHAYYLFTDANTALYFKMAFG